MTTDEGKTQKYDNLTESQKKSAYFSLQNSYDPLVYENTCANYIKILGMLFLFYIVQMLHWFGNYSLGIHFTETCTYYNVVGWPECAIDRLPIGSDMFVDELNEPGQPLWMIIQAHKAIPLKESRSTGC